MQRMVIAQGDCVSLGGYEYRSYMQLVQYSQYVQMYVQQTYNKSVNFFYGVLYEVFTVSLREPTVNAGTVETDRQKFTNDENQFSDSELFGNTTQAHVMTDSEYTLYIEVYLPILLLQFKLD